MKSTMTTQTLFSNVPKAQIERSSFDRSHGYKGTLDQAGILYPFYVDEALPGDTFNCKVAGFARLATPLKPIMDNMYMSTFFFSVPYRLLWDNFKKFCGEQSKPGDSTDFTIPQVLSPSTGFAEGSIFDYLGVPTKVGGLSINALPLRALNLIYNEWFRDQNLIDSLEVPTGDGPDLDTVYTLQRRGKRHDYFTSGLPYPVKNSIGTVPLGQNIEIQSNGVAPTWDGTTLQERHIQFATNQGIVYDGAASPSNENLKFGDETGLQINLTNTDTATVRALREAFQIQRLFERDARGGSRYKELILSHFGINHPDLSWRPEYLGGGTTYVNMHVVPQTSPTGTYADTPQGNLSGFGTASFNGHGFTKSWTEHSIVLGLICIHADQNYQFGLNRMWSRKTRFDHYWPALSHLGEQEIKNSEIYAQGSDAPGADDQTWAYAERYAEYRYKPSQIVGKMRSNSDTSLDVWHLAQDWSALPPLNKTFIEENPPISRCIAVVDEPHFIIDLSIGLKCARPMPVFGVPGWVDHF